MKFKSSAWITVLLLAVLTIALPPLVSAGEGDGNEVLAANGQFYAALNQMFVGEVAPMAEVWSHADDVNYMGPGGGLLVGWAPILKEWEMQAARKLGGKVEANQTHVTTSADSSMAVVITVEEGQNIDAKGDIQKVSIRATNVFRKEDGAWKMIGHHTDLLPFLAQ